MKKVKRRSIRSLYQPIIRARDLKKFLSKCDDDALVMIKSKFDEPPKRLVIIHSERNQAFGERITFDIPEPGVSDGK